MKMAGKPFMRTYTSTIGPNGPEDRLERVYTEYDGTVLEYLHDGKLNRNMECTPIQLAEHAGEYWASMYKVEFC